MSTMFVIVPIIAMILSSFAIFSPRTAWYLQEGWKYKNVEPSDAALVAIRIGGVLGIVAAIAFLLLSLSMPARFPW